LSAGQSSLAQFYEVPRYAVGIIYSWTQVAFRSSYLFSIYGVENLSLYLLIHSPRER